ncbi:hypothetical protein Bca52824_082962 [Brassica carinata]|uniref:Uncharacterized protein n=1 Tax=Brassica carinata TaxID=52824 RepID=A0A8X7TTE5_BRACI|nr:hypothetical protein Bca52824_082962 [Brassica carinata]
MSGVSFFSCAAGNTEACVNGRELHKRDLELLAGRGLPRDKNRSYILDISGRILDGESGEELKSLGKLAPTVDKDIDFICIGRVARVDMDKGWCYAACSKCSKNCSALSPFLSLCDATMLMLSGLYSTYRVEMVIAGGTAEGAFFSFDGVMTKLHTLRASEAGLMLVKTGGSSGEAALNGDTDPVGATQKKTANSPSEVVKMACVA